MFRGRLGRDVSPSFPDRPDCEEVEAESVPQPETRIRAVAVVLAGGTGQRVGLAIPKQLLKIAGKTLLEHTLTVFEEAAEIDEVLVMMTPGHTAEVRAIVEKVGLRKVAAILEGGATRNETTTLAIRALGDGLAAGEDCDVLFHDAVRPLLSA